MLTCLEVTAALRCSMKKTCLYAFAACQKEIVQLCLFRTKCPLTFRKPEICCVDYFQVTCFCSSVFHIPVFLLSPLADLFFLTSSSVCTVLFCHSAVTVWLVMQPSFCRAAERPQMTICVPLFNLFWF